MRRVHFALFSVFLIAGCWGEAIPEQEKGSLTEARRGFKTKLIPLSTQRDPVPEPPHEPLPQGLLRFAGREAGGLHQPGPRRLVAKWS